MLYPDLSEPSHRREVSLHIAAMPEGPTKRLCEALFAHAEDQEREIESLEDQVNALEFREAELEERLEANDHALA